MPRCICCRDRSGQVKAAHASLGKLAGVPRAPVGAVSTEAAPEEIPGGSEGVRGHGDPQQTSFLRPGNDRVAPPPSHDAKDGQSNSSLNSASEHQQWGNHANMEGDEESASCVSDDSEGSFFSTVCN